MMKNHKILHSCRNIQGKDGQKTRGTIDELCRTEGKECWKSRGWGTRYWALQRARLEPGEAETEEEPGWSTEGNENS